jgi:hypothetical protein
MSSLTGAVVHSRIPLTQTSGPSAPGIKSASTRMAYEDLAATDFGRGVDRISLDNTTVAAKRASQAQEGGVYSDPAVPLSFFMHPSMLSGTSGEESPRCPGARPARRSLLDSAEKSPAGAAKPSATGIAASVRRASTAVGAWETPKKDRQGKLVDQPITFQRSVKSSGYGQIPQDSFERKKFFQQQEKIKKQNAEKAAAARTMQRSLSTPRARLSGDGGDSKPAAAGGPHIRHYPLDCGPIQQHQQDCDVVPCAGASADGNSPVYSIAYSGDGSLLGVATADSALVTVRLPTNKYHGESECLMFCDCFLSC